MLSYHDFYCVEANIIKVQKYGESKKTILASIIYSIYILLHNQVIYIMTKFDTHLWYNSCKVAS